MIGGPLQLDSLAGTSEWHALDTVPHTPRIISGRPNKQMRSPCGLMRLLLVNRKWFLTSLSVFHVVANIALLQGNNVGSLS